MRKDRSEPKRDAAGLILGLFLGLVFLLGCVWHIWYGLQIGLAYSKVTASLIHSGRLGSVLAGQLLFFAVSAAAVHLAFGFAAWGLARLTLRAFPSRPKRLGHLFVVLWAVVLASLVLAANGTWFPSSRFSRETSWLLADWYGLRLIHVLMAAIAVSVALLFVKALAHSPASRNRSLATASLLPILGIVAIAFPSGVTRSSPTLPLHDSPHLVILGIDSLRVDGAGERAANLGTPHLNAFFNGAHRFTDATTPLARTYGAWVSILTGRHPVTTNARFNLMPRKLVAEGDTLGDALESRGYQTVYATDEVRFANFDESYGFQRIVSPPVGAIDFLLGKFGDLPLINLVTQVHIGETLFPSLRSNRAAYVTYRPRQFTDRLRDEIVADQPSFYAIHLTLSHWPYSWAGIPKPSTPQENRVAYEHAITETDRQFAQVMGILREKGVLDNAIVVVLSDHGEALGWHGDSMLRGVGTGDEIWNSLWGHGTSVMSPNQYRVVLAMRAFGKARIPGAAGGYSWPVSLEDVRPTLQELALGERPGSVDGLSLLPYLDGSADPSGLQHRIRYTETGFSTKLVLAGKYNESGLVNEGASFYELEEESGWVQLRSDRLPELLSQKQRAALAPNLMLAAVPDLDTGTMRFWLTHRDFPKPKRISTRPDPGTEPDAARLWDALHNRFPDELEVATRPPPT